MTTQEIAAKVGELAPKFLAGLTPEDVGVILEAATLKRFSRAVS